MSLPRRCTPFAHNTTRIFPVTKQRSFGGALFFPPSPGEFLPKATLYEDYFSLRGGLIDHEVPRTAVKSRRHFLGLPPMQGRKRHRGAESGVQEPNCVSTRLASFPSLFYLSTPSAAFRLLPDHCTPLPCKKLASEFARLHAFAIGSRNSAPSRRDLFPHSRRDLSLTGAPEIR